MKFKCLGTGSSGNCYIVTTANGSNILLDAGVDIKKIIKEINLNDIDLCFISHEHKDHSKAQNSLDKRGVNVIAPIIPFFAKKLVKAKCGEELTLFFFPVEHGECKCCGTIIKTNNECILYITDFTICKYDLSDFEFTQVIVECNYIEENVVMSKETTRVLENIKRHQSLKGCDLFLSKLNLSNCKAIILIHFSENYSDPIYMGSYIHNKYKIKTLCCRKLGGYDTYE